MSNLLTMIEQLRDVVEGSGGQAHVNRVVQAGLKKASKLSTHAERQAARDKIAQYSSSRLDSRGDKSRATGYSYEPRLQKLRRARRGEPEPGEA